MSRLCVLLLKSVGKKKTTSENASLEESLRESSKHYKPFEKKPSLFKSMVGEEIETWLNVAENVVESHLTCLLTSVAIAL